MKKLFAILAILGVMSVGLPSVLLAQDSPAVEDSVAQSEQVAAEPVESEAAPAVEETSSGSFHQVLKIKFIEGGAGFMSVIALVFILGLAFALERIIYLSLADVDSQAFLKKIGEALSNGNSGGALVNVRGELVGINTAIYSETGNFTGYAFAIPISIAGKVAADLKEYGVVQRAVLGIQVPNIEYLKIYDPKRASELAKIQGVVVEDFSDRSPAKAAGIEKGDIIKAINNVPVRNFAELQNQLSRYRPGDKVKVTVERNGSEKTFVVELINMQGSTEIIKRPDALKMLGAEFKKIPDEQKRRLGIKSGVEVSNVTRDGLFYKEGIKKGFIIMRINNVPVDSEDDVADIVASVAARGEDEDKVILIAGFYPPNGRTQYIAIDLSKK
jgi:serine protease Do